MALTLARYAQKAVPFQIVIYHSELENERLENMTEFCMANLALANLALGRTVVA
jgi:hypothetical protein